MALIANVKIWPVLGMWSGFGVPSSLQMEGLGMGGAMGEPSPAAAPSGSRGQSRNTHQWARKNVLPPQAGIYSGAVISSLPPSKLPSSPSSTLQTLTWKLFRLEHPALLSGVLIQCQGRKGSLWVSCTAAQILSSDIFPALAPPCPGGLMF